MLEKKKETEKEKKEEKKEKKRKAKKCTALTSEFVEAKNVSAKEERFQDVCKAPDEFICIEEKPIDFLLKFELDIHYHNGGAASL